MPAPLPRFRLFDITIPFVLIYFPFFFFPLFFFPQKHRLRLPQLRLAARALAAARGARDLADDDDDPKGPSARLRRAAGARLRAARAPGAA